MGLKIAVTWYILDCGYSFLLLVNSLLSDDISNCLYCLNNNMLFVIIIPLIDLDNIIDTGVPTLVRPQIF